MSKYKIIFILIALSIGFIAQAQQLSGKASYYSKKLTGARTSSGESFHHDSLICAHRTFPFGTKLKVTNPANGREVVVRVIDRGPFVRGRIIDLSWAAAKRLGIIAQGIASVVIEPVGEFVVPFRSTQRLPVPEMQLEVHERNGGMLPVWQEADIDTISVQRRMERTARKISKK